jgi:hypothetical protein
MAKLGRLSVKCQVRGFRPVVIQENSAGVVLYTLGSFGECHEKLEDSWSHDRDVR